MSNGPIQPSTLDGIKRYAKTLKAKLGLTHAKALDAAARAARFQNFAHARRLLAGAEPCAPAHMAYISVPWRVRETKERGLEILTVRLKSPLTDLVKPHHLKAARDFGAFKFAATDHLSHDLVADSQSDARRRACAAARALTFMEATGLRPSASRLRAYPRGDFRNAPPGIDHRSAWFDPSTKAFVLVDEPYSRRGTEIPPERLAWAREHGWAIGRPTWAGIYNPDGGCELYLAADKAKGFDMDKAIGALDALPPPFVEADWDGRSEAMFPPFVSPGAAKDEREPKPRAKRGPTATVGYRPPLSHTDRRRPAKRMPIEAHAEVGRLLKSVLLEMRAHRRVCKPIDSVRCDLDDWAQCEYSRKELSDTAFFDLYYHEDKLGPEPLAGAARIERHVANLTQAKAILAKHYPDCAPLRLMLRSIDRSIVALQA